MSKFNINNLDPYDDYEGENKHKKPRKKPKLSHKEWQKRCEEDRQLKIEKLHKYGYKYGDTE